MQLVGEAVSNSNNEAKKPTLDFYNYLQAAFDFFNERLFEGKLSPVVFTVARKKNVCGYFRKDAWVNENGEVSHEIAVNPAYFITASPLEIYQTIVHELTHAYQYEFGKPSRGGYHNQEWADKMLEIGLEPIAENGGMTGQRVADQPIPGGKFEKACIDFFMAGYRLAMVDKQYNNDLTLKRLNEIISERIKSNSSLADTVESLIDDSKDTLTVNSENQNSPVSNITLQNNLGIQGSSDQVTNVPSIAATITNTIIKQPNRIEDISSVDFFEMSKPCASYFLTSGDHPEIGGVPNDDSLVIPAISSQSVSNVHHNTLSVVVTDSDDDESLIEVFDLTQPISEFYDISNITPRPNSPIKTCYQCPNCKVKVWGRYGLNIGCLDCNLTLIIAKEGTKKSRSSESCEDDFDSYDEKYVTMVK